MKKNNYLNNTDNQYFTFFLKKVNKYFYKYFFETKKAFSFKMT